MVIGSGERACEMGLGERHGKNGGRSEEDRKAADVMEKHCNGNLTLQ